MRMGTGKKSWEWEGMGAKSHSRRSLLRGQGSPARRVSSHNRGRRLARMAVCGTFSGGNV